MAAPRRAHANAELVRACEAEASTAARPLPADLTGAVVAYLQCMAPTIGNIHSSQATHAQQREQDGARQHAPGGAAAARAGVPGAAATPPTSVAPMPTPPRATAAARGSGPSVATDAVAWHEVAFDVGDTGGDGHDKSEQVT